MKETDKTAQELIQDMLSGNAQKIWSASCGICSLSQNHNRIMELVPYKEQMYNAAKNIELGGALAPNGRFFKQAFRIIDFHEKNEECPCCLSDDDSNPEHLIQGGYFALIDTVYFSNSSYIDYYIVQCNNCKKLYKVIEREAHYVSWRWYEINE